MLEFYTMYIAILKDLIPNSSIALFVFLTIIGIFNSGKHSRFRLTTRFIGVITGLLFMWNWLLVFNVCALYLLRLFVL